MAEWTQARGLLSDGMRGQRPVRPEAGVKGKLQKMLCFTRPRLGHEQADSSLFPKWPLISVSDLAAHPLGDVLGLMLSELDSPPATSAVRA